MRVGRNEQLALDESCAGAIIDPTSGVCSSPSLESWFEATTLRELKLEVLVVAERKGKFRKLL